MEHPTGIEPWGNFYMRDGGPNIRDSGLGDLAVLSDALVLELLGCGVLGAVELGRLALTSKSLYCFANLEDFWKGMVIEELGGNFTWCCTWQRTYLVSTGLIREEGEAIGGGDDGLGEDSLSDDCQQSDDTDEDPEEEIVDEESGDDEGSEDSSSSCEEEEDMMTERSEDELLREGKQGQDTVPMAEAAAGSKLKPGTVETDCGEDLVRSKKRRRKTMPLNGDAAAAAAEAVAAEAAAEAVGAEAEAVAAEAEAGENPLEAINDLEAWSNATTTVAEAVKGNAPGAPAGVPVASMDGEASRPEPKGGGGGGRRLLRRVPGCGSQRYLRVRGFYSDLLYQPWFCATLKLPQEWLVVDNIDRRRGLTLEQFRQEYELPNRPVILTDVMSSWPALAKWNREYLAEMFGDREVIVGNMPMPFTTYLSYCSSNRDEMPLYLFDKHFAAVAPSLESDYTVPPQFGEDLFSLLGEEGRPDYRWLILGPGRSGSSFHVDPNATSAWNALLWGTKKWVMYPPEVVPPGVHPSPDGADVATPLSLTEWFVNFYAATLEGKVRPIEFLSRPGELLFVPRGWWHCALNLEESCALTQNFVSEVGLPATRAFLESRRPELVSGCAHQNRCNLYDRFMEVLREKRPEVLAAVEARQQGARAKARETNKLAALFRSSEQPHTNSNGSCGTHASYANGVSKAALLDVPSKPVGKAGIAGNGTVASDADGGSFSFSFSFGSSDGGGGGIPVAVPAASDGGFKFGFGLS